jgi:DNA-binding beta-propeller fold protein YncE
MRTSFSARVVFAILMASVTGTASPGQSSQSAPRQSPFAGDGPIAISMANEGDAVVLQLKGRVSSFNVERWTSDGTLYVVPSDYDASDMIVAPTARGQFVCLLVNTNKPSERRRNFVLQLLQGKQTWTYLPVAGSYVGLGVDAGRGVAYVTNATASTVSRVRLGEEKQTISEVAAFPDAERIGAIAVDSAAQRLFVADSDGHRIWIYGLETARTQSIVAEEFSEIRALIWDDRRKRLYVADAGSEAVWSVDPAGGAPTLLIRDHRFRQPSGVALVTPDLLAVTDELSGSVWSVGLNDRQIRRTAVLSAKQGRDRQN